MGRVRAHRRRAHRPLAQRIASGGRLIEVPTTPCTCGSLRRASRRVSQFYDAALAPVGIKSTQYAILFELVRTADSGTAVTMHELADRLVMDRSTLGHNLRPLERDALVRLRPARDDLRKRHVELTAKGREVMRQSQLLWKEAENRFEVIFGKQPAADLRAVLHGIANNGELISRPIG